MPKRSFNMYLDETSIARAMRDYEDAVQAACALKIGANYIVTRNGKDFEGVEISSEPAGAVLAQL